MTWKDYLKAVLWGIGGLLIIEFLLGTMLLIPIALRWISYSNVLHFIRFNNWFNELFALIVVSLVSAWRASIYSRK